METKNTTENNTKDENTSQCGGLGGRDQIVMESSGVVEADCPNYIEEDDVKDSIAEGYF